MAKRKPVEDFSSDPITYEQDNVSYALTRFDPNKMTAEVTSLESGERKTLPFAHLPKKVKKLLRPL